MSIISKLALTAPGGEAILEPQFIGLISNGGTSVLTFTLDEGFTNVTGTYIGGPAPASGASSERFKFTSDGTGAISSGFRGIDVATFDTTTTPWTIYDKGSIPVGSRGRAAAASPGINSRRNGTLATSYNGTYRSGFSNNSWSNISLSGSQFVGKHNRLYFGTNQTYHWTSQSPSAFTATGDGLLTGAADRCHVAASERRVNSSSYSTNLPLNEVVATKANKIYIADSGSTTSYTEIYDVNSEDGVTANACAVARDGTRVLFCNATNNVIYVYDVDPDGETAEFRNSFVASRQIGSSSFGTDIHFGPSPNLIFTAAANPGSGVTCYSLDGDELDFFSIQNYGMDVGYNLEDYGLGE